MGRPVAMPGDRPFQPPTRRADPLRPFETEEEEVPAEELARGVEAGGVCDSTRERFLITIWVSGL